VTSIFCNANLAGCPGNGPATAALPLAYGTSPKGFIGGGQLGYNYQINRIVLGVETDLSWAAVHFAPPARGVDGMHCIIYRATLPRSGVA
jgi:hypothetical protein